MLSCALSFLLALKKVSYELVSTPESGVNIGDYVEKYYQVRGILGA